MVNEFRPYGFETIRGKLFPSKNFSVFRVEYNK